MTFNEDLLMRNFFWGLCLVLLQAGCGEKHVSTDSQSRRLKDSVKPRKQPTQQDAIADTTENNDSESFEEVLADFLASYNKIEKTDKQVISGSDTLHLHETYYCLHDSSLIIPKRYLWGGDTTKDFIANTFVSKIILLKNKDTVFNKIITKSYFNAILDEQQKKYAVLFGGGSGKYNEAKGGFMFGFSVSIPLTDLGTAVHLVIDKNGKEKIMDDFTFINKYHEEW